MRRWQLLSKRDHHYRKQLSICLGKKRCYSRRDENAIWLTMYPPLPYRWTSLFHLLIAGKRSKRLDNLSRSRRKCHAVQSDDGRKRESTNPQARRQNPSTPPATFRRKCHLQTFNHALTDVAEWKYVQEQPVSLSLDHGWKLHFAKSTPQIEGTFDIDTPSSWTEIAHPNAPITMATGVYTNIITVPHIPAMTGYWIWAMCGKVPVCASTDKMPERHGPYLIS